MWETIVLGMITPGIAILKVALNNPAKIEKVKKYIMQIIVFAEVAKEALGDDPEIAALLKTIEATKPGK